MILKAQNLEKENICILGQKLRLRSTFREKSYPLLNTNSNKTYGINKFLQSVVCHLLFFVFIR